MATDPINGIYMQRNREELHRIKHYHPPRNNFQASEIANCKRRIYYRRAGYIPAQKTGRDLDFGIDGDLHHDQIRHELKRAGVRMTGLKFTPDGQVIETKATVLRIKHERTIIDIGMRLDGFIFLGNRKHVLEIKSQGFWKHKPLHECWENTGSSAALLAVLEDKYMGYMYQIHACMAATKVNRAYLLVKNRSECNIGLHSRKDPSSIVGGVVVDFKNHIYQAMVRRLAAVQRGLDRDVAPRPEFNLSSKECGYCPFKHLCHHAEKRRKLGKKPAMVHPQLGDKLHVGDLKR